MKAFLSTIVSVGVLVCACGGVLAQSSTAPTAQSSTTAPAGPQTPDQGITANGAIGEIKVIDAAARQLIIKTDAGSLVNVSLSDATVYMRLAPGEKTLTNAAKIAFTDVGEGDRVWARGKVAEDRKSVPATALIIMNKVDIAKKQEAERAEWKKRGLLGMITALKPETKEITVSSRSMAGMQSINIPVSDKVEMRRYAPDSIKFSDAKPASFDELKVGDQVRALGDRSPDGASFVAEKVVTGTFKTVAGAVTAVDPATGEVKINDMQTKQPLTIVVKQDAVLRKYSAMGEGGAMMMARPAGGAPAQGAPAGAPAGGGAQGPGGPRVAGSGPVNIQDILERQPTITIADVKVGDTIIVSSTKGADPTRLTAISLISGADTLLNAMAARQQQAGGPSTPNPSAGLGSGIQFGIGLP
jgi:hypothetical protein